MENIFTPLQGAAFLVIYGLIMIILGFWSKYKRHQDREEFLLAGRRLGVLSGAMSSAVTWIWAPALFVGAQLAYEKGLAGVFAFLLPNFFALILFSVFAKRARRKFPNGFTLPQLMKKTLDRKAHALYTIQFVGLLICSMGIQLLAGSTLIVLLTGLDFALVGACLVLISLTYSMIGGLRASLLTDVLQMALILLVVFTVVPFAVDEAGGFEMVVSGFAGVTGEGGFFLEPWVLYSFGIPIAINLLTGPVADQMHWQRAFAMKSVKQMRKTYVLAACIFIVVPLMLSMLGFVAANHSVSGAWADFSAQMVGPMVIVTYLPEIMVVIFSVMIMSGLCSTLDSIFCAVSSIVAIDIVESDDDEVGARRRYSKVFWARLGMMLVAVLGYGLTLIPGLSILYLWLFASTFRSPSFVPTFMILSRQNVKSNTVFWAILLGFLSGAPVYVCGVIFSMPHLVVLGSVLPLIVSVMVFAVGFLMSRIRNTNNHLDVCHSS